MKHLCVIGLLLLVAVSRGQLGLNGGGLTHRRCSNDMDCMTLERCDREVCVAARTGLTGTTFRDFYGAQDRYYFFRYYTDTAGVLREVLQANYSVVPNGATSVPSDYEGAIDVNPTSDILGVDLNLVVDLSDSNRNLADINSLLSTLVTTLNTDLSNVVVSLFTFDGSPNIRQWFRRVRSADAVAMAASGVFSEANIGSIDRATNLAALGQIPAFTRYDNGADQLGNRTLVNSTLSLPVFVVVTDGRDNAAGRTGVSNIASGLGTDNHLVYAVPTRVNANTSNTTLQSITSIFYNQNLKIDYEILQNITTNQPNMIGERVAYWISYAIDSIVEVRICPAARGSSENFNARYTAYLPTDNTDETLTVPTPPSSPICGRNTIPDELSPTRQFLTQYHPECMAGGSQFFHCMVRDGIHCGACSGTRTTMSSQGSDEYYIIHTDTPASISFTATAGGDASNGVRLGARYNSNPTGPVAAIHAFNPVAQRRTYNQRCGSTACTSQVGQVIDWVRPCVRTATLFLNDAPVGFHGFHVEVCRIEPISNPSLDTVTNNLAPQLDLSGSSNVVLITTEFRRQRGTNPGNNNPSSRAILGVMTLLVSLVVLLVN